MNTYNVAIIDDVLTDVLILEKIISNFCININSVVHLLSIDDGIREINCNRPDIIFLDVMFNDTIIFDYLDKFSLGDIPVVFLSSDKDFALNAFKNNAVDFILKPLNVESVILAMNKAIKAIKQSAINDTNDYSIKKRYEAFEYLAISSLDKIDFIKRDDVMFCMADGKYTTFFLFGGKKIVSSKNLGEYEKILDNSFFYRVHHGYIINIKYLISIVKKDGVYCELANRMTIPVSKRKQESFNRFIKLRN
ncbi:LytR/AlgR family response regulator transcription factor [Flavobacterium sp. FlaQc-57]|uniref:LytR/AlgR family response regulator transcription factor n=1 Tax=Flavobacterium sp. FlaQc-57 TaxID=3374186 RepID=UPI003756F0A8